MYQQYQKDVAIVGNPMNIYQVKTLQLLEKNFRDKQIIEPESGLPISIDPIKK
jgi:hypothetical protein